MRKKIVDSHLEDDQQWLVSRYIRFNLEKKLNRVTRISGTRCQPELQMIAVITTRALGV